MTYSEKLEQVLTPEFYSMVVKACAESGLEYKLQHTIESSGYHSFIDYLLCWHKTSEGSNFWMGVNNFIFDCFQLNSSLYDASNNEVKGIKIFK
jgi:hypothetical protein